MILLVVVVALAVMGLVWGYFALAILASMIDNKER